MAIFVLLFAFSSLPFGIMFQHSAPVPLKIWNQNCDRHSKVLNDCNWCHCNDQKSYICESRVCSEVDKFGHFNDAIQDINVGMEGHGAWRSTTTFCEPNVSYQKKELLCMCNEDGNWPNPICRDTFKVLYPVEVIQQSQISSGSSCSPTKLYLVDCNVCLCPSTGRIDPQYCTNRTCSRDDPVYRKPSAKHEAEEIYAECTPKQKYKLGCKTCNCLSNNRLLCDNCTENYCSNKELGVPFNIDCNVCHCDDKGLIYCTVKRCLVNNKKAEIVSAEYTLTTRPDDDFDCTPGTKFRKDCNTCYCFLRNYRKKVACTVEKCAKPSKVKDCVQGTAYRVDCLICQCGFFNGIKMQICEEDPECSSRDTISYADLSTLNGYCAPLHTYKSACNTCVCLQDGKTIKCTSETCKDVEQKPVSVDLVPVIQDLTACPKGQSYKIDCNYCFCLENGNALCTTIKCNS